MKFPFAMLKDFVSTYLTAAEIGDLLTMAGFEVEGIEEVDGDHVLDVKVVSNRGDGLSVLGLAREVLAKDPRATGTDLYRLALERFKMPDENGPGQNRGKVRIETPDCTRYACRMFRGDFSMPAPEKIRKRLQQAGMRSISLLVDLTNYVMLEVGQPMHAFDYDKLGGGEIIVRSARAGEKLTTLNGEEHELRAGQMMICDVDHPIAVAGVMGGQESEVSDGTTTVLLESAHFVNTSVRRTRKQLGLSTEASYRFERSVDPEGVVSALNRFALLLGEVDGGRSLIPGVVDEYPSPPVRVEVPYRVHRGNELLGMQIKAEDARNYLERLGFAVSGDSDAFSVVVPTWRPDVVQEYDVVEEVGRVHGFERIPDELPHGASTQGGVFGFPAFQQATRESLVRLGFTQVISHTLRDKSPLDFPGGSRISPRQPASPELSLLRNSLLPGLADAVKRNGVRELALFETGSVFGVEGGLSERKQCALVDTGEGDPVDRFFRAKGVVEMAFGYALDWQVGDDERFHPSRQATVDGRLFFAQIHPAIAEACDLPLTTILAEWDLGWAYGAAPKRKSYKPVSRNPAVRRDMAILIDKSVAYRDIEREIAASVGDILERQWLFDIYSGKGIPEGKHSLAIALQLRKMGENLTDEEANQVRDSAVQALAKLGGTQR